MSGRTGHFCLIATDGIGPGGSTAGYTIAMRRLNKGVWPIYDGTRNKNVITIGDRVLIYVGGKGPVRQAVIGSARVADKVTSRRKGEIDEPEYSGGAVDFGLKLNEIILFDKPVFMSEILRSLDLCPRNSGRWGVAFMGGLRKWSALDYDRVIHASKASVPDVSMPY